MSTVEEAASLFGTSDAANDPFASTLAENTEPSDANIHAGNEPFFDQNYDSTSDIFGTTTSNDNGDYNPLTNTNETTTYTNAHTWNAVPPSSYDYSSGSGLANGDSTQGQQTYGGVTEVKHNGYPSYEPVQSVQSAYSANGSQYNSTQYANGYDASQYSYNTTSSVYSPPVQSQVPTAYDPYAHPQTTSTSNSQAIYDPYKPSQAYAPQQTKPYAHPHSVHTVPPVEAKSQQSFTADVPPPVPSASVYRLKTSNAYDPPLPPPKPSRRTSGWQVPTSPGMTASYPLPNTVVQPILSPPPPPRSVNRQHTQPASPPSYAPAPGPQVDHYNTLPPHIGTQPTGEYASETHWSQPSPPQSFGKSSYAPPEQSVPSRYSPSNIPPASVVSEGSWANLDQTVSQVMDDNNLYHPHSNPEPAAPNSEGVSQNVASEPSGDDFIHTNGDSWGIGAEPAHTTPNTVGIKPSSPPISPYNPMGNGHHASSSSRQHSPARSKSPGSTSIRSWGSGKRQSVVASPPPQVHDYNHPPPARSIYDPPIIPPSQRTASPSVMSIRSTTSKNAYDAYTPSNGTDAFAARDRSMSNASLLSVSSSTHDPYAPSLYPQSRQQSVDDTIHGAAFQNGSSDHSFTPSSYGSQVLSTGPRPTHTPYAPSPSLLGTNDPLGRASARIPVISFGFGGRIVTCFHGSSSLNTGFDVALSSRPSTDIHFRVLNKVIPESALDASSAQFPGPLFSDPGTPSTSIIGSGAAAQTKAKKARVIKYLEERAEEISQGIGYLQQGNTDGQNAQAKHVLVKLLKVMVENDGRLSGSATIDTSVRAALLPYISNSDVQTDGLKTAVSIGFPRVGDSHPGDLTSPPYPGIPSIVHDTGDSPIAVNTLRASNLDRIQEFLIRGERRAAFQYAADEKLWAHAMVIASSIDKEAWKDVVSEFVRTELTNTPTVAGVSKPSALDGREPLKVAYSLFAGQGAASVQELLPPKPLVNSAPAVHTLQSLQVLSPPAMLAGSGFTPMTPNFPQTVQAAPIPPSTLAKWTETAAMMISSPMTNETSSALTSLGDQLAANGWVEAAHCCYLLSPQTSPFGGIGVPSCRVHLLGASPGTTPSFWKDPDTIILSEIVEFALSLVPSVKGQEPFNGLPHLQAYRLIRAMSLAELGYDQQANRYCEAITQSISRSSPYIHATLVEQLKGLSDRLIAAPHVDKSGSWIGTKMAKPSLDKLGNWLEGRFTSFIAGEADSPQMEDHRGKERAFGGPFTHYSTISSTTTSAIPSPHMSTTDLTEIPPTPPYRTGSAMALRSSAGQQVPINRASSAMDYIRRKASPVPRVSSANALTATIPNTPSFPPHSYGTNGLTPKVNGPSGNRLAEITPQELSPTTPSQTNGSWWGVTDSGVPTPTAASFVTTSVPVPESSDGFISLMDDPALSLAPSPAPSSFNRTFSSSTDVDVDDDDLGLSNKSHKPPQPIQKVDSQQSSSSSSTVEEPRTEPSKTEERPEPKQQSSGGWLSKLWGGGAKSDKPAPIKANLGETQTSFYYDKDLKRWVNKNASSEPAKSSAPPPPPRAQTASPGTAGARMSGLSPAPPPPARPATTVDLSEPPRKPPMRIRSNLVPPETASAPTTPASSTMSPMNGPPTPGLNGPPSARLKTQAKRSVRSRYVDVFQQQGAA